MPTKAEGAIARQPAGNPAAVPAPHLAAYGARRRPRPARRPSGPARSAAWRCCWCSRSGWPPPPLLTGLGSLGSHTAGFRLANLALATAVNVGLYLLAFRVLTPRQVPTRQLVAGAMVGGIAWQALLAIGGYLVGHNLKHASEVYGFFAVVLGLLSWLFSAPSSPCTPPRSTSSAPAACGRAACCNPRSPSPTSARWLTWPSRRSAAPSNRWR
jgi:hypothetical protein